MADDKKKKISLGGIDNAAEEKGSFMKTLWQLVKFLVVSGLVTIIQLVLANVLPLIFDGVTATLPVFLQGIFDPNVIFDASTKEGIEQVGKYVIDGTIQNGSVVGGVVTWGYLLPFFLSNLIANIYGFYQNKTTNWAWIQPLARTIAGLAAGFVQMVVLFPMEKFVLLKEKKKDGEEVAAEAAAE